MKQNGLAAWFQQNKSNVSLLCREDESIDEIMAFTLKQTAFPAAFEASSAKEADMQAETD
ncbi:hypothetical protein JCM19046_4550 [Bacillus sp. JCM 19046]|uniref:Uncharacterized protein n=1 Tax=Shouchella xiaoxiensis TaxID=766895 RepID=A0ABS2SXI8_9BACI|nr:hypothetical protein [Shouchella xiaoxiensis]MBM7840194.1 hypothetical protein [Shouchella xiaoxiensis]GAF14392.1 hypothetical protein JCM19045_3704 [Bacillus sp. JCM 19045]GAF19866.1 hypothetical protein JCM19046_4550 [Bacillus sp. JCM 19046]